MTVIEARVSKNSNPATTHIGRYVVQTVRVTETGETPGPVKVTSDPATLVAALTAKGLENGVWVELIDETGE